MSTVARQQKAIEIADKFRIVESSGKWIVNEYVDALAVHVIKQELGP